MLLSSGYMGTERPGDNVSEIVKSHFQIGTVFYK